MRAGICIPNVGRADIDKLARAIAKLLGRRDALFLCGPMGSGKTYFTQRIGDYFNISNITSPSFNLMKEYSYKCRDSFAKGEICTLFHLDLWRMENIDEFWDLDIDFQDGICIIEWADKFPIEMDANILKIEFGINYANIDLRDIVFSTNSDKFADFYS